MVDYARARSTIKRSGDVRAEWKPAPWTTDIEPAAKAGSGRIDLLDLDAALATLGREDQSLARLIEMRYFGGMTAEEAAQALGQSVHVIRHDLRLAQAWLRRKLRS